LGKFPALLDDALNWLPARLTGWLLVASAWLTGENAKQSAHTMLTQHNRTASPNAGWTMAAAAGALNITLTKRDTYKLEGGQQPITVSTIDRALRLADVGVGLVVTCSLLLVLALKNVKRKDFVLDNTLRFAKTAF